MRQGKVYLNKIFAGTLTETPGEGYNRQLQAKLHHIDIEDDFGILLSTAYCDTPGAVTIKKD